MCSRNRWWPPLILTAGIICAARAQTVWDPPDDYDFSPVRAVLDDNLAAFSDQVVVLIERDGVPLFSYEYGFDANSVTGIASASKLVSGSIMLALRDDDVFELDDNVGRIEWVPLMAQQGKDFTIRQAYAMASGVYTETPYEWLPLYTLEQAVTMIALNATRGYEPGTAVWYDGSGMQTVGLVAERATGLDWASLADGYLFAPCEMFNSSFTRFAPNPAIAGGVETCANDYMKLLRTVAAGGVYKGGQVLSPAAVDELFADQNGDNPILNSPFPENSPWYPYGIVEPTYGFGAWVLAQHPVTGVIEEILSPGAWGTSPWIDRRRGVYGIFFTEVPAGSQSALAPTLQSMHLIRGIIDDADDDVIQLSIPGEGALDPELLSSADRIVYQDEHHNLWLARLDPDTGLFADSTTGKDILLSDQAAPLAQFWNAGEFAREQSGWSVYYSAWADGAWRIWRAHPDGQGGVLREMLTDSAADRGGMIVSDSPNLETSYVAFVKGAAQQDGEIWWFDRRTPQEEHYVGPFIIGETIVRWVPNEHAFVVSQKDPHGVYQLFWYDALTHARTQITTGAHHITHPFPFLAAEYDDELMIAASEADERILILRQDADGEWIRQATLEVPPAAAFTKLASPEVFTFRGRSYVSLKIASRVGQEIRPAEVWVFGVSDNPHVRFTLRVDGGDDGPEGVGRSDPEPYVGADDVFVVYNVVTPQYEFWRSRTHMTDLALPRPGDLNADGNVAGDDLLPFTRCSSGPAVVAPPPGCDPFAFGLSDQDDDDDVDLADFAWLQRRLGE